MIKLTDLLGEEFTAISNKSGKTVVFKDKDSRDDAVKAGTHSKEDEKDGGDEPKGEKKPNMFSKDAGYDAPDAKSSKPKKSEPFNADKDEKDFRNALEGDGYSWYSGSDLEGVTTFGDENGNTVAISAGSVYDDEKPYAVSGYNEDDDSDTNYKSFDSKDDAIAYAKELGQKLKKQNSTQKYTSNSEEPESKPGLPSQIAKETGVFRVNKGELTPKETTVKDRKFISKVLSKRKFDPYKRSATGNAREDYEKRMMSIIHDTLEDANFHGANRQIFADLQGKPELAKRPDYSKAPEIGTPEREEWDMNNSIYNKNFDGITSEFDGSNDLATKISSEYGWDGEKAIAAILWKMRTDGSGELADKIQTSFDKAMKNNEGKIKLTNLL